MNGTPRPRLTSRVGLAMSFVLPILALATTAKETRCQVKLHAITGAYLDCLLKAEAGAVADLPAILLDTKLG